MTEPAHADKSEKTDKARQIASEPFQQYAAPQFSRLDTVFFHKSNLARLQRAIGNQAVLRLLQRQETTAEATATLTDAQIQAALAWYEGQSRRYTPEIIQQIRRRVGRGSATGAMTAEDVRAIARWQADNGIESDGRAGTTTLAVMFPMGLSEQESISAFAEGVSGLQSEWETLPPDQRLDRLEALVNQRLEADGLPHITLTMDHSTYHTGAFDYTDWHMPIAERILTGVSEEEAEAESIFVGNLPEEDLEELIITVYHEARHSEQWFRMAQMLAGRGQSTSYITHHLDIPEDIAAAAVASPLPEGSMEALIAQGWYDTYYGRDAGETSDTYARTRHTHADQEHSEDVFEDSHSHESWETMEGARRRFDRAVDRYEDMPHEADAFRTEEALRTEMVLRE